MGQMIRLDSKLEHGESAANTMMLTSNGCYMTHEFLCVCMKDLNTQNGICFTGSACCSETSNALNNGARIMTFLMKMELVAPKRQDERSPVL
jgi:hypothetical protein